MLRKKVKPLKGVAEEDRAIFEKMLKIMYRGGGIGLAAPQVGLDKQMIVADIGDCPVMLANPRILEKQGEDILEEGCLSLPDVTVKVKRAKKIVVEALDVNGKKIRIKTDDILARVIQHETDHLKGKLIIDYAGFAEKLRLRNKLKEISQKEKSERLRK